MARSASDMRIQLRDIGIVGVGDQDRIIAVARQCAAAGMSPGAGWTSLGSPAVAQGVIAKFLSGFVSGSASCVGLSYGARAVVKKLGSGAIGAP